MAKSVELGATERKGQKQPTSGRGGTGASATVASQPAVLQRLQRKAGNRAVAGAVAAKQQPVSCIIHIDGHAFKVHRGQEARAFGDVIEMLEGFAKSGLAERKQFSAGGLEGWVRWISDEAGHAKMPDGSDWQFALQKLAKARELVAGRDWANAAHIIQAAAREVVGEDREWARYVQASGQGAGSAAETLKKVRDVSIDLAAGIATGGIGAEMTVGAALVTSVGINTAASVGESAWDQMTDIDMGKQNSFQVSKLYWAAANGIVAGLAGGIAGGKVGEWLAEKLPYLVPKEILGNLEERYLANGIKVYTRGRNLEPIQRRLQRAIGAGLLQIPSSVITNVIKETASEMEDGDKDPTKIMEKVAAKIATMDGIEDFLSAALVKLARRRA